MMFIIAILVIFLNSLLQRDTYQSLFESWFHNERYYLIFILLLIIAFCLFTMILVLVIVLTMRSKRKKESRIIRDLKSKYQHLLINYLYEVSERGDDLKKLLEISNNSFNRKVLINEMIDLSINLSGEPKKILRELYVSLGLHKDSLKKAYSSTWHIKIKGFRELAFMDIHDANAEIKKCLNHSNPIVRMEAQIALVRLNEEDPFNFLDLLTEHFTIWEQMNVYETIIYHDLPIPEFKRWLVSENKSVLIFALRMIKLFKQKNSVNELLSLIDFPDEDVRFELYTTMGTMRNNKIRWSLKNQFLTETPKNKMAILKALARFKEEEDISFFKTVLEEHEDVNLQILAAKGIRNVGEPGKFELQNLIGSENYRNYQIILKHVLDERL